MLDILVTQLCQRFPTWKVRTNGMLRNTFFRFTSKLKDNNTGTIVILRAKFRQSEVSVIEEDEI